MGCYLTGIQFVISIRFFCTITCVFNVFLFSCINQQIYRSLFKEFPFCPVKIYLGS